MNIQFILLILVIFYFGCQKDPVKNSPSNANVLQQKIEEYQYGKIFFDYDHIDYYHINVEEDKIIELDDSQNKSKADQYKYTILTKNIPKDITDLDFLNSLTKIGYSKKEIQKSKFDQINKIFVEKNTTDGYNMACVPIFRDILIFKKRNKVIGVAKICFTCHQYHIIGTDADIKNFGMGDDYEKLGSIIDHLWK